MQRLEQVSIKLRDCGFNTDIFKTACDAARKIYALASGHTVGIGSSMTVGQMGIVANIQERAKQVFWHQPGGKGQDERDALTADVYLTSANAVSLDGHIVNIDGTGNRVAATCFGPRHVIYLIGKNKVVDTLAEALNRAKATAVTLAKHFHRNTPCTVTGICEECQSPECVCSVTVIHRRRPNGLDVSVFLIDEELGW